MKRRTLLQRQRAQIQRLKTLMEWQRTLIQRQRALIQRRRAPIHRVSIYRPLIWRRTLIQQRTLIRRRRAPEEEFPLIESESPQSPNVDEASVVLLNAMSECINILGRYRYVEAINDRCEYRSPLTFPPHHVHCHQRHNNAIVDRLPLLPSLWPRDRLSSAAATVATNPRSLIACQVCHRD